MENIHTGSIFEQIISFLYAKYQSEQDIFRERVLKNTEELAEEFFQNHDASLITDELSITEKNLLAQSLEFQNNGHFFAFYCGTLVFVCTLKSIVLGSNHNLSGTFSLRSILPDPRKRDFLDVAFYKREGHSNLAIEPSNIRHALLFED